METTGVSHELGMDAEAGRGGLDVHYADEMSERCIIKWAAGHASNYLAG